MRKKTLILMTLTLTLAWGFYVSKYQKQNQATARQGVDNVELANKLGTTEVADLVTQTISLNQLAAGEIEQRLTDMQATVDTISKNMAQLKTDKEKIQHRVIVLNKVMAVIESDEIEKNDIEKTKASGKLQRVLAEHRRDNSPSDESTRLSAKPADIVDRINQNIAASSAFLTNIGDSPVFSIAAKHLLISGKDVAKVSYEKSAALVPEIARIKSAHGVTGISIEVRDGTPAKEVIALTDYVKKQFGIEPTVVSVTATAAEPLMMRVHTK